MRHSLRNDSRARKSLLFSQYNQKVRERSIQQNGNQDNTRVSINDMQTEDD